MTSHTMSDHDLREHLWDAIEHKRTGMLGACVTPHEHMQPMTAHVERETGTLWFYTYNDTHLANHARTGQHAMFCIESKDNMLQACIGGMIHLEHDPDRIKKFWNPMVGAWFPEGKNDPRLTMIRFDLDDAKVWLNDQGRIAFMYQVAKANITNTTPDPGINTHIKF